VFVSSYSSEWGPDGDVVDLGWASTLEEALQIVIDAYTRDIVSNTVYAEGMAELCAE